MYRDARHDALVHAFVDGWHLRKDGIMQRLLLDQKQGLVLTQGKWVLSRL